MADARNLRRRTRALFGRLRAGRRRLVGGHSLLAVVLVARRLDRLGVKISLKTFMNNPTVRVIDRYLDH